jgi:hypothetical protein
MEWRAPPRAPAASVATNGDEVLVLDRAHVGKRKVLSSWERTRSMARLSSSLDTRSTPQKPRSKDLLVSVRVNISQVLVFVARHIRE